MGGRGRVRQESRVHARFMRSCLHRPQKRAAAAQAFAGAGAGLRAKYGQSPTTDGVGARPAPVAWSRCSDPCHARCDRVGLVAAEAAPVGGCPCAREADAQARRARRVGGSIAGGCTGMAISPRCSKHSLDVIAPQIDAAQSLSSTIVFLNEPYSSIIKLKNGLVVVVKVERSLRDFGPSSCEARRIR